MTGKRFFAAAGVILALATLGAQSGDAAGTEWALAFGGSKSETFNAVRELPRGGYVAVGSSQSYSAPVWVLSLKPDGRIKSQWAYSGTGHSPFAFDIRPTSDGGFLVAGGDGETLLTSGDGWLMKLTARGKISWQKRYSGSTLDMLFSASEAPGATYLAAGGTYSFGAGSEDGWVIKVDARGDVLWERTYGGSGRDSFRSIRETPNGDFLVAGFTDSFGAGAVDAWLLLLDSDGNVLWEHTYGGADRDLAFDALATTDGDFLLAGNTPKAGKSDAWIAKVGGSGAVVWQKTAGGPDYDGFTAVQESDDEYVAAGYFASPGGMVRALLVSLDRTGRKGWQKSYGAISGLSSPHLARAAEGLVMAVSVPQRDAASYDAAVFRLDAHGEVGGSCAVVESSKIRLKNGKVRMGTSAATVASSVATVFSSPLKGSKTKAAVFDLCER